MFRLFVYTVVLRRGDLDMVLFMHTIVVLSTSHAHVSALFSDIFVHGKFFRKDLQLVVASSAHICIAALHKHMSVATHVWRWRD